MITILTLFIFTGAFVAAAEYSWWAPQRRARQEIEQRLRGLRVETGRQPASLLRQQSFGGFNSLPRFDVMKSIQASIDQAKLPYRAGNVLLFSFVLLAGSYFAADTFQLFPFLVLKVL